MKKNPLLLSSIDRLGIVALPITLLWLGVAWAF